jgi:hypothetical protein
VVLTETPKSTATDPAELLIEEARRRQRRRRLLTAFVILVVTAAAVVALHGGSDGERTAPSHEAPPVGEFQPPWHLEGDNLVVRVAFLTGGHAEVLLPRGSLEPHDLSFVPGGAIAWTGRYELGRTLEISRGTIADEFSGQRPEAEYHDASGRPVPFYTGPSDMDVNYLAFQFGDWVVKVWDYPRGDPRGPAMTEEQRRFWAAHVAGHVTAEGFLVLDPKAPLVNSMTDTPDARLDASRNSMGIIMNQGCSESQEQQGERTAPGYFMTTGAPGPLLCDPNGAFRLWMGGDPTFTQAARTLQIRNITGPLPTAPPL